MYKHKSRWYHDELIVLSNSLGRFLYLRIRGGMTMLQNFEPTKLYYGFPVFFLGYKDEKWKYNISTCTSSYTLGDMMVIGMGSQSNAVEQIKRHQEFTVCLATQEQLLAVEQAGFNSHRDKFQITSQHYQIGETVDAPIVEGSPICIECKVTDTIEFGEYTNFVAKISKRSVEEELINHNQFQNENFHPILYTGDGKERVYRHCTPDITVMGSVLRSERKRNRRSTRSEKQNQ